MIKGMIVINGVIDKRKRKKEVIVSTYNVRQWVAWKFIHKEN